MSLTIFTGQRIFFNKTVDGLEKKNPESKNVLTFFL